MLSGVAYVDPTIRDIAFKQSDKQLKISDTILGAKITPEQKKDTGESRHGIHREHAQSQDQTAVLG